MTTPAVAARNTRTGLQRMQVGLSLDEAPRSKSRSAALGSNSSQSCLFCFSSQHEPRCPRTSTISGGGDGQRCQVNWPLLASFHCPGSRASCPPPPQPCRSWPSPRSLHSEITKTLTQPGRARLGRDRVDDDCTRTTDDAAPAVGGAVEAFLFPVWNKLPMPCGAPCLDSQTDRAGIGPTRHDGGASSRQDRVPTAAAAIYHVSLSQLDALGARQERTRTRPSETPPHHLLTTPHGTPGGG